MILYLLFSFYIFNIFSTEDKATSAENIQVLFIHGRAREVFEGEELPEEEKNFIYRCIINKENSKELTKVNSPVPYLISAVPELYKNREKFWFLSDAQQKKDSNVLNPELLKLQKSVYGYARDNQLYALLYPEESRAEINIPDEHVGGIDLKDLAKYSVVTYFPSKENLKRYFERIPEEESKYLRTLSFLVHKETNKSYAMALEHLSKKTGKYYLSWWVLPENENLKRAFFTAVILKKTLEEKQDLTLDTRDEEFLKLLAECEEFLPIEVIKRYSVDELNKDVARLTIRRKEK
jgi:hypothetical protein